MLTTEASTKKAEMSTLKEKTSEQSPEGSTPREQRGHRSEVPRLKPAGAAPAQQDNARHEQRERSESRRREEQRYREKDRDYRGEREYRHRLMSDHKSRGESSSRDRDRRDERRYSRSNSTQKRGHHVRSPENERRSLSRTQVAEEEQIRRSRSRQRSEDRSRAGSGSRNRGGKDTINLRNQNTSGQERGPRKKSSSSDTGNIPFVVQGKMQRSDFKVREIWLGNLPENISRQVLYSHFFICGEIEDIEILKQPKGTPLYAFIRFKLTGCTKRAYDIAQGLDLDGYKTKVQFADCNRRGMGIVGDVTDYDLTPANCTTLFIAFSVGLKLPDQVTFQTVFQKHGRVRAVWMKHTEQNSKYRPHAFVDYFNVEDAQKARREMYDEDKFGQKRSELGDKNCEVLFAIKKRNKDFSQNHLHQQNRAGGGINSNRYELHGQQLPPFHALGANLDRPMGHMHPHQHPLQLGFTSGGIAPPPHNLNHQFNAHAGAHTSAPHLHQHIQPPLHLASQNFQPQPIATQVFGNQSVFQIQQNMQRTTSFASEQLNNNNNTGTVLASQLPSVNLQHNNPTPLQALTANQSQSQPQQQQPPQQSQQKSQQPQKQLHPMVLQILQLPQLQNMRQQNPDIAAKLEVAIQMNPDPKNIAYILQTIIMDHKQVGNQQQQPIAQSPAQGLFRQSIVPTIGSQNPQEYNEQSFESQQASERGGGSFIVTQQMGAGAGINSRPQNLQPPSVQPNTLASGYFSPNPSSQGGHQQQRAAPPHPGFGAHQILQTQPQQQKNQAGLLSATSFNNMMQASPQQQVYNAGSLGSLTQGMSNQFNPVMEKQNSVQSGGGGGTQGNVPFIQAAISRDQDSAETSFNIIDFIKKQKQTADMEEEENSASLALANECKLDRVAEEDIPTEPAHLFDDDEKSIWSGFVTRNKQFRVCMMAYTVIGENNEFFLPDRLYNLNVSLRANFEDVEKFESQGVVAFVPQGDTYEQQFQEYIDYFNSKQRVGVAFLDKGIMFLLPPSELSRRYFTSDRPHMVGIFGDQQAAAAQSAQYGRQGIRQSQEMGSRVQ